MSVSRLIARRYLPFRRGRGGARGIALVAICGIAVASAAIVCILSVFNGFRGVLLGNSTKLTPEVVVLPAKGKVLADAPKVIEAVRAMPEVSCAAPELSGRALAVFKGREMPVVLRGVTEDEFRKVTAIDSIIYPDGKFSLAQGVKEYAAVHQPESEEFSESAILDEAEQEETVSSIVLSAGVAARLGAHPGDDGFILFTPRRDRDINLANPVNSFITEETAVSGVFMSKQEEFDKDYVIADISVARSLFSEDADAASAVDIALKPGTDGADVAARLQAILGPDYKVKDRLEMQSLNFRMVSVEKWITFLLLAFILLIAAFNIVASLSMLVIEKQTDLNTLRAMGMTRRRIGAVFVWESLYITLAGTFSGMAIGIALCMAQKQFGLIRLAGNADELLMSVYPVEISVPDLAALFGAALVTGVAAGLAVAAFAWRRSGTVSLSSSPTSAAAR